MFKIGDKVKSTAVGEGTVVEIKPFPNDYPIVVEFLDGVTRSYTEKGQFFKHSRVALSHLQRRCK